VPRGLRDGVQDGRRSSCGTWSGPRQNSTELSSNALAIITRLGELLSGQDKKKNATAAAGHGRRLLGWQIGETPEEETSGGGLLDVNGRLNEIEDVTNASRQVLLDMLDEIEAMSQDSLDRRAHGLMSSQLYGMGEGGDLLRHRHLLSQSLSIRDENSDDRNRRSHLSNQLETIANTSAEVNRQLLAEELVVWTSLGPLPRWVPGPTTRWAPGTIRLALHGI
jgi:hypothetical protein